MVDQLDKQQWRIADLIDLEFFLDQDEGEDLDRLATRDREIYSRLASRQPDEKPSRSDLLKGWLQERRTVLVGQSGDNILPGRLWQEFFGLFFWAVLLSGLLSGGMLAFSFLSYSGARPVNVSAYFGIFVVFEVVLLLLFILLSLYRHLLGRGLDSSLLYRTLQRFFYRIMANVSRRARARVSAETREQWSGHVGSMRHLQQRYGRLLIRPFFLLAQLFGISFNAGVLAATLLKIVGSDVAFGWQTTLQISSETVYTLVRWISLPWSWFMPSSSCPSMEQILGSQLILKDGLYHLTTHDLVSWWPFLWLSVACYAFLPRLLLFIAGLVQQRHDLAGFRFNHGRYRQLVHRMQSPLVSTRATVETKEQGPEPDEPQQEIRGARVLRETVPAKTVVEPEIPAALGLVPDELFEECPRQKFRQQVRARLGYDIVALLPVWTLERSEDEELEAVREAMTEKACEDVLLLQEAWQPPIQELLSFLEELRTAIGERPTLVVVLVGKPVAGNMLTPVKPLNLQIWQRKLHSLSDPGLQLVELVK